MMIKDKPLVTVSIVTYNHSFNDVYPTIKSVLQSIQKDFQLKLYITDNSKVDIISNKLPNEITYIQNPKNIGYGAANNIAIKKSFSFNACYHLVLNPDVYFNSNVINKLFLYMQNNKEVGLIQPKILYPNGELYYNCKLLPSPYDLIIRRFLPFKKIIKKNNYIFEMKFTNYNKIMNVPYLHGSFMLLRVESLKKIGLFDERFFLYPEDIDLTRRLHEKYKTLFYPEVIIYHDHNKGSYKSFKLMIFHIISMIKYFNKWGWFWDKKRRAANLKCITQYHNLNSY